MKKIRLVIRQLLRACERRARPVRALATAARALLVLEAVILGGAVLFALTGSRAEGLDALGARADLWLAGAALALLTALHFFLNKRLLGPILERRFAAAYDERVILFDLGQAARTVTTTGELYQLVVDKIREALHVEHISIFVRDDETGDYECRVRHGTVSPAPGADGSVDSNLDTTRRNITAAASSSSLPVLGRDAFIVKRLRNLGVPLGIEPRDLETWTRALAAAPLKVREARRRETEILRRLNARLLLQIMMKDRLVGIIVLGPRASGRGFSAEDKRLLMSVAGQMAFIIENAKLVERMVEEGRLRRELALAAEVQQRLFPARAPATKVLDLAGYCLPARGVGGDYYDFLLLDNEQIGISVADVAGKGIGAALLMSIVQASLRSQAMALNPGIGVTGAPADLVSTMNRLLWRSTGAASYVTFFYAQFDERARRLTYTNAGHNAPLLLRAKGDGGGNCRQNENDALNNCKCAPPAPPQVSALPDEQHPQTNARTVLLEAAPPEAKARPETPPRDRYETVAKLATGGPVIGVFEDCYYEQETIELQPGDLLVAYTDGVTEALNRNGEEFGEARLEEALAASAHLPAEAVRASIVARVREWCGAAPQHDDLTFIVMKVK